MLGWTALFLALLELTAGLLVSAAAPELGDEELGPRLEGLRRRVAARPDALVVLALGSSRVQCGFVAASVEAPLARATGRPVVAYDLGVRLGFATTDEVVLRRALAAGIRPAFVLVEALALPLLDPSSRDGALFPSRLSLAEARLVDARFPASASWADSLDRGLEAAFPAHRARVALQGRFLSGWAAPELADEGDLGWRPVPRELLAPAARERARARARDDFAAAAAVARPVGEGPAADAWRALLALLARERIPAALVVTPEGPAFRSWYEPATLAAVDRWFEELARAQGTLFVAARDWFPEERFEDGHHLDVEGARAFTARLEREVLTPCLAGGAR